MLPALHGARKGVLKADALAKKKARRTVPAPLETRGLLFAIKSDTVAIASHLLMFQVEGVVASSKEGVRPRMECSGVTVSGASQSEAQPITPCRARSPAAGTFIRIARFRGETSYSGRCIRVYGSISSELDSLLVTIRNGIHRKSVNLEKV